MDNNMNEASAMKTTCPDEETLVDYLEGRLSDHKRTGLEDHLSGCDACLEEIIVAGKFDRVEKEIMFDPVPAGVTQAAFDMINSPSGTSSDLIIERVKRSIEGLRAWLSDFLSPVLWRGWRLASIRGSGKEVFKDLVRLRKTFGEIAMDIEIEKKGENRALIRVRPADDMSHKEDVRVTLKKGNREISSGLLNRGYVLFEDIPFGHYSVTSSRDGVFLGEYLFKIKETHYGRR
jgi:hypothetical protein